MAIKNLSVDDYKKYNLWMLEQLRLFARREPDNSEVVRELAKIEEAIAWMES